MLYLNWKSRDYIIIIWYFSVWRDKEDYQQPNISHWSYEKGYNDTESVKVYPQRSMRPGARGGLSVFLLFKIEDQGKLCNLATHGVKVFLRASMTLINIMREKETFNILYW